MNACGARDQVAVEFFIPITTTETKTNEMLFDRAFPCQCARVFVGRSWDGVRELVAFIHGKLDTINVHGT